MGSKTPISWTQSDDGKMGGTWNVTDGCECVSPGCANCYAMRMAGRFSKPGARYHGLVTIAKNKRAIWNGTGSFLPSELCTPARWRAPRRIFVESMSDLFFKAISFEEIAAVFGVMAATPRHTYQVLTKRPERMLQWFQWIWEEARTCNGGRGMTPAMRCFVAAQQIERAHEPNEKRRRLVHTDVVEAAMQAAWPLPNVWLGTSAEDQERLNQRLIPLLGCEAVVHFLSCEPLLGPLELGLFGTLPKDITGGSYVSTYERLNWIITGCESGPGARPCERDWLASLASQCNGVSAFFLKQAVMSGMNASQRRELARLSVHGAPADAEPFSVNGIGFGPGSALHGLGHGGPVVELPFLNGQQHRAFPNT